jgi:CheY-like chemotaxis protein
MPSNILLIDDGVIDNYIFETLLQQTRKDFTTTVCPNGKIALKTLEHLKFKGNNCLPEYIIVDLTMPTMNGWEFLNEFTRRNIDPAGLSKVYIITSSIFESDRTRSKTYPFISGFITKPINTTTLNKILS